jgi:hypothetical protein
MHFIKCVNWNDVVCAPEDCITAVCILCTCTAACLKPDRSAPRQHARLSWLRRHWQPAQSLSTCTHRAQPFEMTAACLPSITSQIQQGCVMFQRCQLQSQVPPPGCSCPCNGSRGERTQLLHVHGRFTGHKLVVHLRMPSHKYLCSPLPDTCVAAPPVAWLNSQMHRHIRWGLCGVLNAAAGGTDHTALSPLTAGEHQHYGRQASTYLAALCRACL